MISRFLNINIKDNTLNMRVYAFWSSTFLSCLHLQTFTNYFEIFVRLITNHSRTVSVANPNITKFVAKQDVLFKIRIMQVCN